MKLRLSEEFGIYTKFYVLHFFVWADLWPYCNAYVRPVTRATEIGSELFLLEGLISSCLIGRSISARQLLSKSVKITISLVLIEDTRHKILLMTTRL